MAFFFPMVVLGLMAIVLKMIIVKMPFVDIHPFLEALPVLYGAMRMRGAAPFWLAGVLGALVDILSPQKFGTGIFVLCLIPAVVWTQRDNIRLNSLGAILVLSLVSSFVALVPDYALFCWQSGNWDWHFTVWVRIALMSLFNMVLAVPFFWIWDFLLVKLWKGKIAPGGEVRGKTPPTYAV
jgi:hypothetical protein